MPFPDESFAERVVVSAAQDGWAREAAAYVGLLTEALPMAPAVDHIGSTSVPGLPAKDCLDLMVQVAALDRDVIVAALTSRGFRLRPEPWNHEEVTDGVTHRKLVFGGPIGSRAVNVHVRVASGRNVRFALLFRDFLCADGAARDDWGAFKSRLAASVVDLMDYGQIKAAAQPLLMRAAEEWAVRTGWDAVSNSSENPSVLGVDGCRAGWVGLLVSGTTTKVLVASSIGELISSAQGRAPDLAVVAIDMPIGLSDGPPRAADLLARRRLPVGRKSSVFPAPTRVATLHATHVEASAANREATGGSGLSIQAFRLVPKILEVDAFVREGPPCEVVEAHPEVSFAAIDPACVVPSKRTPDGARTRSEALRRVGLEPPAYVAGQGYGVDDLLDACVLAWTAARVAAGAAETLPDPPERFADGIPAAIRV